MIVADGESCKERGWNHLLKFVDIFESGLTTLSLRHLLRGSVVASSWSSESEWCSRGGFFMEVGCRAAEVRALSWL